MSKQLSMQDLLMIKEEIEKQLLERQTDLISINAHIEKRKIKELQENDLI